MWKIDPQGTLIALGEDAGSRCVVWVPSEELVFHYVELPPGRQRMWEQAVPFMLEEQLIERVEEQHFVIGRAAATRDGRVPVAVSSLALMASWVASWENEKLSPGVVCPDVLAVPFENGKATLWHEKRRCLLRLDQYTGFAGSPKWIQSLLAASDGQGTIDVYSDDPDQLDEAFRERAQVLPCSLEDRMCSGPDRGAEAMNFLQGVFRPVSVLVSLVQPWKWAGAMAAALFVVYTASLGMQTRLLNETAASLQQATLGLYQQHFQEEIPIASLRPRVNQRMSQFKSGEIDRRTNLWKALGYVEPILSSCKACRVEEILLEKFSMSLLVSSSEDFDDLLRKINKLKQFQVSFQSLDDLKDRKRLSLQIEMKAET